MTSVHQKSEARGERRHELLVQAGKEKLLRGKSQTNIVRARRHAKGPRDHKPFKRHPKREKTCGL